MNIKHLGVGIIIGAVLISAIWILIPKEESGMGGAGFLSNSQFATTTAVGPDEVKTLFSSNNYCKGRVITTGSSGITFTMSNPTNGDFASSSLSSILGHWQAASTTKTYSSDDTGCGFWSALGVASSTVTIQEF